MKSIQKANLSTLPKIILPALTILFGLQMLRAFLPYLQYLLGDRLGLSSVQLGLVALGIFVMAFVAGRLNHRLGLRRLLLISAGGVGLARLLAQLWTGDPLGDMALVTVGIILFMLFLPAYLVLVHWQGDSSEGSLRFAQAILLGLAVDTTLHGTFHTYDIVWHTGFLPLLITGGLVLLQWLVLRNVATTAPPHLMPIEGTFFSTLPWLAIGPFLFLQLLIFQNQARLITLTGWLPPLVFGWILISHLFGLGITRLWQPRRIGTMVMGLILVIALWPVGAVNGLIPALSLLAGQVAAAALIVTILQGIGARVAETFYTIGTPQQPKEGIKNTNTVHGISMLLLVIFIFAFYVGFSLPIPYQNSWLLPLAGLIIGLCGVGAANMFNSPATKPSTHLVYALPLLLLLFPIFLFFTWHTPTEDVSEIGDSIRVITYNVHNGFNTDGQLDMEALAQVIEAEQPDIVALQEVSRGWVVNGSMDMVGWLSQRLDMPFIFAPSADALWGQAVLSRYPYISAEIYPLPPSNLPLKRSFVYLQLDIGRPAPLQLVNTHLHHRIDDSAIRINQVETILDFLTNYPFNQIIMTGDLNAISDAPEIQLLYEKGFDDAVIETDLTPGYTFKSSDLFKRLDYILISPDLVPADTKTPKSTASDHLSIVSEIWISN